MFSNSKKSPREETLRHQPEFWSCNHCSPRKAPSGVKTWTISYTWTTQPPPQGQEPPQPLEVMPTNDTIQRAHLTSLKGYRCLSRGKGMKEVCGWLGFQVRALWVSLPEGARVTVKIWWSPGGESGKILVGPWESCWCIGSRFILNHQSWKHH